MHLNLSLSLDTVVLTKKFIDFIQKNLSSVRCRNITFKLYYIYDSNLRYKLRVYHQGPFKGTVFYGFVSTLFVAVFTLEELIDMLSIGTLIAYAMACVSLIRLRYVPFRELNGYGGRSPCKSKSYIGAYFTTRSLDFRQ